jgi:hypothetical protein
VNPTDPLAQLRDIHLPETISWWPLAIGWWVVVAICLLCISLGAIYMLNHFFGRRYRRQALAQLKRLPDSNQHQRLVDLFSLLRQVASSAYPEQNFSSLSNREFIAFLQKTSPKALFVDLPNNWEQLFYSKQPSITADFVNQLIQQGRLWIKQHPRILKLEQRC